MLALLLDEPGSARVRDYLPGALLSSVNLAEIVSKFAERGMPAAEAAGVISAIGVDVVDYDPKQAVLTGALRVETRGIGLSLGDRACLALARLRGVPAVTADQAWSKVSGGAIVVIRPAPAEKG